MAHPHKELIIKLLDDPTLEVEWFDEYDGEWYLCGGPLVNMVNSPNIEHRLREKPKPDVVRYGRARIEWLDMNQDADNNVKFTFTHDGTLKNAEVI